MSNHTAQHFTRETMVPFLEALQNHGITAMPAYSIEGDAGTETYVVPTVHYWVNTYYGPAQAACGDGGAAPEGFAYASLATTTCFECLTSAHLTEDGADA